MTMTLSTLSFSFLKKIRKPKKKDNTFIDFDLTSIPLQISTSIPNRGDIYVTNQDRQDFGVPLSIEILDYNHSQYSQYVVVLENPVKQSNYYADGRIHGHLVFKSSFVPFPPNQVKNDCRRKMLTLNVRENKELELCTSRGTIKYKLWDGMAVTASTQRTSRNSNFGEHLPRYAEFDELCT